jgi:hypothetical protein
LTIPVFLAKLFRLYNKETDMRAVPLFRLEIACQVINAFLDEHQSLGRPSLTPDFLIKWFRRRREAEWAPRGLIHKVWVKDEAEHHSSGLIVVNIEIRSAYGDHARERELSAELNRRVLEATDGRWCEPVSHTHVPDERLQAACDAINQYLQEHNIHERHWWSLEDVRESWEEYSFCERAPRSGVIDKIVLIRNQVLHSGQIVYVIPGSCTDKDARALTNELRPRVLAATGGKWEDPIFVDKSLNSPS